MFQTSMRRPFLVFVLALVLGSTAVEAAPAGWTLGELGRTAWLLVNGVWWPRAPVASPKAGCSIDPDGAPRSDSAPKHGCSIDPDGATLCDPASKHGCSIDPNG
jgi:hypothetical protein